MTTDVDVQYFSHLNGLALGNNWGDLIRLLDKALVTGIDFTQITTATIDTQGDVHITLYSAHNAMLLQVVELTGFTPASLNQKYRIKGVPSATQLILKPKVNIVERLITTKGAGKLAALGYDIIFRDLGDVKRVYRAKNPTAQHPFIRVDESISDGANSYNTAYAKYAMVGLLENMTHIDDYQNPNILQLPFDPSDLSKNWKISGTGTSVVRGWSKWYWARFGTNITSSASDSTAAPLYDRPFTLIGDADAFYFLRSINSSAALSYKQLSGCGLARSGLKSDVIPPWFLMTTSHQVSAGTSHNLTNSIPNGGTPLALSSVNSRFFVPKYDETSRLSPQSLADPIIPDYASGYSNVYPATHLPALEIPFSDTEGYLRGSLKHIFYRGKLIVNTLTSPETSETSMYVSDSAYVGGSNLIGGFYFYLGELE